MIIHIKFMVSLRCKMAVKDVLDKMGLHYNYVVLGEAELIEESITQEQHDYLNCVLQNIGLELIDSRVPFLVESIKIQVVRMLNFNEELPDENISDFLGKNLKHNYTYLSNLFKKATGITIQHFILLHKVEKIKELILNDELNLNEISYKLHYSSAAHLSNQFKKITGVTPSCFKKNHSSAKRVMLENIQ